MPIFFTGGFRPFFLGAAVIALLNMLIWIGYLAGSIEIYSLFSPSYWHLHEMMFGFVGAAIAGFLLTAMPNWTGRPALKGFNLASLFGLWILGRVTIFYSEFTGAYFAAIADLPLFFILGLYIFREISAQGTKRNLPIVILIFLFGFANALMHAELIWGIETEEYGYRLTVMLVATLIMLIGGRVIPSFTTNWLKQNGGDKMPILMNRYDLITILWTLFSMLLWVVMPVNIFTGYLFAGAAILNAIRLSRWQFLAIAKNPILLILHVAYAWLVIGLLLFGVVIILQIDQMDLPIHAITVGGFTTMILAVMTRASLGHTGRKIIATKLTILVYICINISVIARLSASIYDVYETGFLYISAATWMLAFGLFIIQYAPYFFTDRK
ncbi:MAG: NnrS family protein [Alphaproteobacteria bacterium]|nr:NnrS family protein [Alphaproteobacteria bacterium]